MSDKELTPAQQKLMNKLAGKRPEWFTASSMGCSTSTCNALVKKGLLEIKEPKYYSIYKPIYYRIPLTLENLGIQDAGESSIKQVTVCTLPYFGGIMEREGKFYWGASAYLKPRFTNSISNEVTTYVLVADRKEDIMWAINKYVVPVYEKQLETLKNNGALCFGDENG